MSDETIDILVQVLSSLSVAFNDAANELMKRSDKKHPAHLEVSNSAVTLDQIGRNHQSSKSPIDIVSEGIDIDNYHEMSNQELKRLCKERKLGISGAKWDLITRLVAHDTKEPKVPKEAIKSFRLKSLERRSNSTKEWNPKCHSGQDMSLFLHICKNDNQNSNRYLHCLCQCGKGCLNGWALGNVQFCEENSGALLFHAADTNGQWKNYPCEFKAHFCNEHEKLEFTSHFKDISVPFDFSIPNKDAEDDDFHFQSQIF